MSGARPSPETISTPAPVATVAEAERLISRFTNILQALVEIVQQETDLVRAGGVNAATALETSKADLTRLYVAYTLRLRASSEQLRSLVPDLLSELRRRHDAFHALLQINLTVLATAHAVSEGIVRGVSGEMARKLAPQTYGASGRTVSPPHSTSAPLTMSREL